METSNNQRLDEQQRRLDFEGTQLDWRQQLLDFDQLFHQGQQSVWEFRKRQQQIEYERLLLQGQQIVLDFGKRLEEISRKMKQNDGLPKRMQESRSRVDPISEDGVPSAANPSISAILASNPSTSDMIASGESDSGVGSQRREINHSNLGAASVKISEGGSDPTISWGIGVRGQATSIEIDSDSEPSSSPQLIEIDSDSEPSSSPQLEVEGARQELDIQSVDSKVIPCPLDVVILEELEEGNRLKGMLVDQREGNDAHKVFVKMPTRTSFGADALGLNFSRFKPRIDDDFGIEQGPMANSWPYDRGKGVLIVNTSSLLDCGMEGVGFKLLRSGVETSRVVIDRGIDSEKRGNVNLIFDPGIAKLAIELKRPKPWRSTPVTGHRRALIVACIGMLDSKTLIFDPGGRSSLILGKNSRVGSVGLIDVCQAWDTIFVFDPGGVPNRSSIAMGFSDTVLHFVMLSVVQHGDASK